MNELIYTINDWDKLTPEQQKTITTMISVLSDFISEMVDFNEKLLQIFGKHMRFIELICAKCDKTTFHTIHTPMSENPVEDWFKCIVCKTDRD